MNNSPLENQIHELRKEIESAKERRASLSEDDHDFEVKDMVISHGLESLEQQYESAQKEFLQANERNLKDSKSPQCSRTALQPAVGFAPYAGNSHNTFGEHSTPKRVVAGQGRPAAAPLWDEGGSWSFAAQDENIAPNTPSLPLSEDFSTPASASSSEPGFVRPQKRQRESLGLTSPEEHKAKATCPSQSPAETVPTTPSSLASFELPNDPEFLRLVGGDPLGDMRMFKEEQAAIARIAEEKRQRELADAAFARSLQESDDNIYGSNMSGPSATPRGTSQTILDNQGQFRRPEPLPHSSSFPAFFAGSNTSNSLPLKHENTFHLNNSMDNGEGGSSLPRLPNPTSSNDFIDLDNGFYDGLSDPSNNASSHPSSDVIEIDPEAFNSSVQSFQGNSLGEYGSTVNNVGANNWSIPAVGQGLVDGAKGVYNAAYNLLDQTISSYGNNPLGYGNATYSGPAETGSASNYIDLAGDDQPLQNPAYDVFNRHGINPEDPANSELVASYWDRVNYVTNDPTRTAAEIKSLLENIRPDEELPPESREGTPEAMKYNLMEHQKLGLTWMKTMEAGTNKGGILADAMGLGKTIQGLALMVSSKGPRERKTNLIICPVALLKQWEREIHQKLKSSHQLKTYILHGEKKYIPWSTLKQNDVVLTTYGTIGMEVKRREGIEFKKRVNPNWRPASKSDCLPLLDDECKWYRVILDEAQCVKNKSTKAAVGVALLQAEFRWCMTGTPMMNNVNELYSLIHFLRIKPYCESGKFNQDFSRPLKSQSDALKTKAMRQLQALLKAILLRRTKKSQIDGRPILNLPERTTEVQHALFSEDEITFYRAVESGAKLQFNKFLKAGTVGRNYSNILVLLLRLRQVCCHPHLIKNFAQASGDMEVTPEDMVKLAKELAPDVIGRIKEQCAMNDQHALECPVCLDPAENSTIFFPCGHNTCSECFARITDPSQAIAEGNGADSRAAVCPNCRGKVIPTKVIDLRYFKKVHMPEAMDEAFADPQADIDTTDEEDVSDSDDDGYSEEEVDSKGNLRNFIVDDDAEDAEEAGGDDDAKEGEFRPKKTKKAGKKSVKGKEKAVKKDPQQTLAHLRKLSQRNLAARRRYLKRLRKEWMPSAKILKTIEILDGIMARKDPETKQSEKTIIFSQFTSLLDLLEVPIDEQGWGYRRYDGSMSSNARNDAVMDFSFKDDCKIMLVSLKAGNAGLNLVAASQVIILDPFWNPYIEEQAIDRAHRIGQQRPVQVHRILVPDTVEDRILALQEKKRELIEGALDEKASQTIGRLGVRELGFLFDMPT